MTNACINSYKNDDKLFYKNTHSMSPELETTGNSRGWRLLARLFLSAPYMHVAYSFCPSVHRPGEPSPDSCVVGRAHLGPYK